MVRSREGYRRRTDLQDRQHPQPRWSFGGTYGPGRQRTPAIGSTPGCDHAPARPLEEGTWSHQAVVALALTQEDVPVKNWVLLGNTADVDTVEKVRSDLRGWNLSRVLFVADSGMNSTDNLAELAKACGTYLLACRMASVAEIKYRRPPQELSDWRCYIFRGPRLLGPLIDGH